MLVQKEVFKGRGRASTPKAFRLQHGRLNLKGLDLGIETLATHDEPAGPDARGGWVLMYIQDWGHARFCVLCART
jgi:hypothetical protein